MGQRRVAGAPVIEVGVRIGSAVAIVDTGLVVPLCVGISVYVVRVAVGRRQDAFVVLDLDGTLVGHTALGGHKNHTVRTAVTVDSGCGCVFEDAERFDLVGVEVVERTLETVHDDQRGSHAVAVHTVLVATEEGAHATDTVGSLVAARHAGILAGSHTQHAAGERVTERGDLALVQLIRTNRHDGSVQVALLGVAVRHVDDIVGTLSCRRFLQHDTVETVGGSDRLLQFVVVVGIEDQHGADARDGDGEVTVLVRFGVDEGVLDRNLDAHHRKSLLVDDVTGDGHRMFLGLLALCRRERCAEHQGEHDCNIFIYVFHSASFYHPSFCSMPRL